MAEPRRHDRVELFATLLLTLAAVATAWSSYQANRWNGEQAKATSRTNATRIQAARAQGLADDQKQTDLATFIQWVDAYARKETALQTFYRTRFRGEFRPAFDAWLGAAPFGRADAPLTPFVLPQYQLHAAADAARLDAAAEASAADARRDIQRSANYVLAVVLFAVALFFAGMSSKLESRSFRKVLLGTGFVILAATIVWIATFPVRVSI